MIRGTTPTHTFNIPFEASMIKECRVLYAQDDVVIVTKSTSDCILEGTTVKTTLSQQDTFKFDSNKGVQIQLRILTKNDVALASVVATVGIDRCLEDEVMM